MVSPASVRPLPLTSVGVPAVLVRARVAVRVVGVAVAEVLEVMVAPAGFLPAAVAVLVTAPVSTSFWLIV